MTKWYQYNRVLTAYAILSPFESAERGVGCPRVVEGEAAKIASECLVSVYHPYNEKTDAYHF